MVKKYNCPGCGADMAYDPALGKLSCSHCGYAEEVSGSGIEDTMASGGNGASSENSGSNSASSAQMLEYHCPNCGSVLVTGERTTSVSCEYCDAPLVLADRLSGNYRQRRIIPFSVDKKAAVAAFKKWCHNGWFTPGGFTSADNIKKLHGTYVPYWIFNMRAHVVLDGTGTRVRVRRSGETEYTTTDYFQIHRDGFMDFANVPYDASAKMPDTEMAKLEPYHLEEARLFSMPYLAGFDSDQYDYEDGQLAAMVQDRVKDGAVSRLTQTLPPYATVNFPLRQVDFQMLGNDYTLLPVWSLSYIYKNKEYRFMMNGQTGRVVGKAPVSIPKLVIFGSVISAAAFIVQMILGVML